VSAASSDGAYWTGGVALEADVVTVCCEPSGREATVIRDATLMEAINQVMLPLAQACDGVALCGFCRVLVVAGWENLSPVGDAEAGVLRSLKAGDRERLACCARISGPVAVTTSYW
jgi:ferredoxin